MLRLSLVSVHDWQTRRHLVVTRKHQNWVRQKEKLRSQRASWLKWLGWLLCFICTFGVRLRSRVPNRSPQKCVELDYFAVLLVCWQLLCRTKNVSTPSSLRSAKKHLAHNTINCPRLVLQTIPKLRLLLILGMTVSCVVVNLLRILTSNTVKRCFIVKQLETTCLLLSETWLALKIRTRNVQVTNINV